MLTELRIRNFGVIVASELTFDPGLTVLTGETGAGKTMVVAGLGQLLGARGEAGIVRHGTDRALVEGRWIVGEQTAEAAVDLGAEMDGDELLTSRHITAAGRSRALVGGAQTTVGSMADLLGELATIHGQSDQLRLGSLDRQRDMLDAFADHAHLDRYRDRFAARRAAASELGELTSAALERAREIDVLAFGLDEIAAVNPQPGEDAALTAEFARLQAADDLRLLAEASQAALSGGDDPYEAPGVLGLFAQARKAIEQAAATDPQASGLAERLAEANFVLNDLSADVSSYLADLVADPVRLEVVTGRRAELASLTRKYGHTVDEVLEWSRSASERLTGLQGSDERIAELTERVDALTADLTADAQAITAARTDAAERLAAACEAELAALAMPRARLRFAVSPLADLGPHGADRVELMFAANPGSPLAPLAKVASGGELSRVRLALEVVLASGSSGHTFVFDEVDAGVGGAVGLEIGRRLKRLAGTAQVIVVTHLAQVAAFADRHHVVTKSSDSDVTIADIRALADEERIGELARMMGGIADSDAALAHARDLLAEASRQG